MRHFKAQSAMEYLMTYGWAILIIAVVLSALFSLGVFSSGSLLGTSCVAAPGYLCSSISLAPIVGVAPAGNDVLSFTFGQSTGSAIYNVAMGCAATSTSTGMPYNGSAGANSIVLLGSNGGATRLAMGGAQGAAGGLTLQSGQSIAVNSLVCFTSTGSLLSTTAGPIGTAFSGALWLNYTLSSGAPSASNPSLTAKFATITAKVA